MIIGIVGSRRRNSLQDRLKLHHKLWEIAGKHDIMTNNLTIVTGDCNEGGDKFARKLGKDGKESEIKLDVKYKRDPAGNKWINPEISGWVSYWEFTRMCYDRNEEIAKEPLDYLIALVAPDRKGGTENTIKYFKRHHKDWKDKLIIL